MKKITQEYYEAFCLEQYKNPKKMDRTGILRNENNCDEYSAESQRGAIFDDFERQGLNETEAKSGRQLKDVPDLSAENAEIRNLITQKGFFNGVSEPFIFVELSPKKSGLAWLCEGNTYEQISLKKYKKTEKGKQEYIKGTIPVIREVDVGICRICHKYFCVKSIKYQIIRGLPPKYCQECREKRAGKIRTYQIKMRGKGETKN